MSTDLRKSLIRALQADDLSTLDELIQSHPDLLHAPSCRPAVTLARSVAGAERLLRAGSTAGDVGNWWAPGFGTRDVSTEVARFLVDQGASLTVHAAAGLGLIDRLSEMLAADPALIHAKGGDGCTPLHFARDLETAKLLLDRGARVDERDEDHDSTPAQWLIGDAPDVVHLLLSHGATPDIFLAAALGDRDLAGRLIAENPECVQYRIGKRTAFPPIGHKGRGGTIYQWTLAFNSYPHQIALRKGHAAVFDLLYEKSDTTTRFLVCCLLARRPEAEAIVSEHPDLVQSLPSEDLELVARYCWETNTNYDAVKLMLDLGFPVAHPEGSHGYSPLHNAAWAGSADLVDLLIERGHPVNLVDSGYNATPLGWAIHDCIEEKRHPEGEFASVVRSLLKAGAAVTGVRFPTGNAELDAALAPKLNPKPE